MSSIDRIKRRRKEIELEQSNLMSTDKSLGKVGILRDEISSTGGLDYGANLEELAPVRKESWLKGGAFDDGYDFGDISKTIGGTIVDAGLGIAKGIAGVGESAGNLVVSGIAQVSDWFNNDEYANKLRNRISGKDEEYNNRKNNLMLSNILNKGQTAVDSSSVLGDKSDSVSEGLGYYMGMLAAQSVGVPWQVTSAATSMGNELTNAYANNATDTQAWFSAANSAAWEIASEYLSGGLKLPGTGKTVEAITGKFLDKMKSKTIKGLAGFGVNAISEGAEEIISSIGTALGQKISYMSDKEFKDLYNNKQAFDDFITGALVSGITMGVNPTTYKNIKTGRNLVTGYTANEQSVIDKEVENRINELEKNGNKISNKEKNNIEKQVKSDLKKGYISTDLIESLISGDTYQTLKDAQNKLDTINKQINELESKKMSDLNVGEWNSTKERLNALRESLSTIDTNSLRKNLDTEINEKIKSDELLKRSYQEKYNRSVKYEADVSKYNSKQQKTIQNAIDSGILNNTNKTHEFVNMIAKLSAEKGIDFDFVNNAKLKDSGFSIDGKQVNGYVNENGITINIDSKNALNSIVGHEITHVLEGTELYTELQNAIKDYATIKGIYNTKLAEITELYKNVDGAKIENELTSDLVGEYLFTDVDFVNKLSIEKPNIFKKIWEEIKYLYKIATADSKEARELEKVKRTFEEAYRQSEIKLSKEKKFSKAKLNSGEDIVISDDINGTNPSELKAKRALERMLGAKYINKSNSNEISIENKDINKYLHDGYYDNKNSKLKKRIASNYGEILEMSKYDPNISNVSNYKGTNRGKIGFDYYNVNLAFPIRDSKKNIVDYKYYEARLVVRKETNGNFAYDLDKFIEKKGAALDKTSLSITTGKPVSSSFDKDNISQPSNNVNSDTSSTKYSMQKNTNDTQELDNSSFSLEQRVSGDALLDAQDFIDEVKSVGAEVDENGYVTVYHQTSNENAGKIRQSGKMIANEDYVYFSTSKDASQSEGRGQTKLEFKIPAEKLMLDDIFSDNADVKIPLKGKKTLDVSNYLVNSTKYSLSSEGLEKIANEFGRGKNYWEANLYDKDLYGAIYYLKHDSAVKEKFKELNNIKIEPVYKDIKLKSIGSKDVNIQKFIKDNNLNVIDLVNNQNLLDKFYELEHEAIKNQYNIDDNEANELFSQWKGYFEEQKNFDNVMWPLLRFERDFKNIIDDNTKEVDNIETAKIERQLVDENPEFEKYVTKYAEKLFNEKIEYDVDDVMEEAKINHGTTDNFEVGAYMTTDGSLLNFNDGGFRDDHRTISVYDLNMKEFMDYGAIRMQPETPGFEMQVEPTSEQYSKLYDYIDYIKSTRKIDDKISADIDKGNSYDSASYNMNTPTSKIIDDIKTYWKTGSFPKKSEFADFYYSLSREGEQIAPKNPNLTYGEDIKFHDNNVSNEKSIEKSQLNKIDLDDINTIDKNVQQEIDKDIPNSREQVKPEQVLNSEIAKILVDEPQKTNTRNKRKWAIFKANILDKGSVFEDLSLKSKNRELMSKWDYTLTSQAIAQNIIGNGHIEYDAITKTTKRLSKSLNEIRTEVDNTGKTYDFYNYMYHKHNVDRMNLSSRFEGIDNKPVFGEEITSEISQQIVNEYENAHPEFIDYANDVYDYVNADRQQLVKEGVISQKTADLWQEMYPHYVPIRRIDNNGTSINVPLDTRKTGINAPIKKAKGGNEDILPLFDTIAMRTLQTYKATAKNSFGVELKNTLNTNIEVNKINVDEVIDSVDNQETLLQEGKNGKNPTFTVFENGEKVTYDITQDMYDALKPISDSDIWSKTFTPFNKISNFHRGVLTQYNLFFALTNAVKDAQDVLMNSQHPAKTYSKIPEAWAQQLKKGYWYQEYMANGGEQNSYFNSQENTFVPEKKGLFKLSEVLPLKAISTINDYIEMTPRLAEYIASREAGRSIETSMLDAARVTTNFKAGGDITKWANRNGFTFLNASVQGFNQQVRNIREANAKGLKGWATLATKFAVAGLPALLLNALLWDDDDDYEELSDYVKQNYYIVAKYGDGEFIRIPKGRTLAVIQNAMEQVQKASSGNDEVDFREFIDMFLNNLAPNNPIENNVLSPIVQAATNRAWYGGDLVPTRLQDLPAAEQYDESTDSFSKFLGEKLNVSPYKINYVLDQYTGFLGDMFLPMATPEAKNDAENVGDYLIAPLKSKFTADSVMNNKNTGELFETSEKLTTKSKKSNATDEDKLKNKFINSMKSEMNELYKQKREIQNSDLSKSEKYNQVREIQKEINELSKYGLDNYKDVQITGNYATVGNREYRLTTNTEGEETWNKITDKQKAKQEEVSNALGINACDYWDNKEEYDYAYENPGNYEISKVIGGYETFKSYSKELNDIKSDKDSNGKTIANSRKQKVFDYINSTDLTFEQRVMLAKLEYPSYDEYNNEIIEYLNNSKDISYKEEVEILKQLGFEVDSYGNISW